MDVINRPKPLGIEYFVNSSRGVYTHSVSRHRRDGLRSQGSQYQDGRAAPLAHSNKETDEGSDWQSGRV